MTQIPEGLVNEIHDGNCVAFVGAGFSAAVIPPWGKLLNDLASHSPIESDIAQHVGALVLKGSAHAFDEAAQVLEDHLGRATFLDELASLLTKRDEGPISDRLSWLRGIVILVNSGEGPWPAEIIDAVFRLESDGSLLQER